MKEFFREMWCAWLANTWVLFHPGHFILTECLGPEGGPFQTTKISTGKGSLRDGTWKEARVFYTREYKP